MTDSEKLDQILNNQERILKILRAKRKGIDNIFKAITAKKKRLDMIFKILKGEDLKPQKFKKVDPKTGKPAYRMNKQTKTPLPRKIGK